jgi:spore germination protein GerM
MRNDRETQEFQPPAQPLFAPTDPPMAVKLFFPSAEGQPLLAAQDETIFKSDEVVNRAKQILQKLQDGPHDGGMLPSMPRETKVQDLFVSEQGTAFIDFSNTIAANHPGGVQNELATIYSVVNSLTYNLPEIQEVKILVGGIEKETLAGHCLLHLPLTMDLSITNVGPREDGSASVQ